jgi:hypothetical protein
MQHMKNYCFFFVVVVEIVGPDISIEIKTDLIKKLFASFDFIRGLIFNYDKRTEM